MNAFETRLKTASLLLAIHWVGAGVAADPVIQPHRSPLSSATNLAPAAFTGDDRHAVHQLTDGNLIPSENFDVFWVTYPGTLTKLPHLHLRFQFQLDAIPDAAIIETVAGVGGIVRLGYFTADGSRHVAQELRADQNADSVDSVKLTSPNEVFTEGTNFVEVVCRDVEHSHGVIALLQLQVAGVAVIVGTDETTEVSLDGNDWKQATKRHEFDSTYAPVVANSLSPQQAFIRQYANSLVSDCRSNAPSVAGNALQQLTRLTIKNGGYRYCTTRYLYRENVLWTLRDQYLETLATQLQSSDRNLQLNALRSLSLFLKSDTDFESTLAGAGAIALMPSSIKSYAEPVILAALQRSVTEYQIKRASTSVKLDAAVEQKKEAKQAAAIASRVRQSALLQLQALQADIERTDQLAGKATANVAVANQIGDDLTKSIRADQSMLGKLDAQSDQATALRKKIDGSLNQLRDQSTVIGVNQLRLKGLQTEAKDQIARRIELKAALTEAEATLAAATAAETKANQSSSELEQNAKTLDGEFLRHLATIEAFLKLHSFETTTGRMLVVQLHQIIEQTRLTLHKIELAAAGDMISETVESPPRQYGAPASASMIPTATEMDGIRHRPGVSHPAPYDHD